jgi:hypothetical protein
MNEIIEAFQEINWAVIAPIIILNFILMIVALIDCFKRDNTNGPQWMWILVIIFVNFFGPILYFLFGRRNDE